MRSGLLFRGTVSIYEIYADKTAFGKLSSCSKTEEKNKLYCTFERDKIREIGDNERVT
jgi:hypothetical protein